MWEAERRRVIARKGKTLFERQIQPQLPAAARGKFVVVDTDTGHYEIDRTDLAALRRMRERYPEGDAFFITRVGESAAYRLGGRKLTRP